jgi:hypothetical protein
MVVSPCSELIIVSPLLFQQDLDVEMQTDWD